MTDLPAEETQWLDPTAGLEFVPWPGEETIRRGAVGRIQAMLETGQDPAGAGGPGGGAGEGKGTWTRKGWTRKGRRSGRS